MFIKTRQHLWSLSKRVKALVHPFLIVMSHVSIKLNTCQIEGILNYHNIVRIKIVVDGVVKFDHGDFNDLLNINDNNCKIYDLEEYLVPSVIRKILKTTKLREIVVLRSTKR